MVGIIVETAAAFITEELFKKAFLGIKSALKRINEKEEIITIENYSASKSVEYINTDIEVNIQWASSLSFQGSTPKDLNDVYIDIDLALIAQKEITSRNLERKKISISKILVETDNNIVLLGAPGAGKTTSVKKIYLEALQKKYDIFKTFNFPILIQLKKLKIESGGSKMLLFNHILSVFGIFFKIDDNLDSFKYDFILKQGFKEFIERLDVLIILDGFDEITDKDVRENVLYTIDIMSNCLINSRFILTSRSSDYNVTIDNSQVYEIAELDETQIEEFITKRFPEKSKADLLLSQLKNGPYWDTAMRPLLLTLLCTLFERHGEIPDKPKDIYRQIITLLLEKWSQLNRVKRKSIYGNFGPTRKEEFLSVFAYSLVVLHQKIWFDRETLKEIYLLICGDFGLPEGDAEKVITEIESHNGLIIQSGGSYYEFSHKSLTEYLVASYLKGLPIFIKDSNILKNIPNELAIWISLTSSPGHSFYHLVYDIIEERIMESNFLKKFLTRLIIENADFEVTPLFSLTCLYIINTIAKKDYIPYERVAKIMEDYSQYHNECNLLLLKLTEHVSFSQSINMVKNYYELAKHEDYRIKEHNFGIWGLVAGLKRTSTLNILGSDIEIPEYLFIPKKLIPDVFD